VSDQWRQAYEVALRAYNGAVEAIRHTLSFEPGTVERIVAEHNLRECLDKHDGIVRCPRCEGVAERLIACSCGDICEACFGRTGGHLCESGTQVFMMANDDGEQLHCAGCDESEPRRHLVLVEADP
jgi:hypothetical protein